MTNIKIIRDKLVNNKKLKMSEVEGYSKHKFIRNVFRIIHSFVEVIMRFLLRLVYGGPGELMPPIKNLILLESASSLALKIRTKKVLIYFYIFLQFTTFV